MAAAMVAYVEVGPTVRIANVSLPGGDGKEMMSSLDRIAFLITPRRLPGRFAIQSSYSPTTFSRGHACSSVLFLPCDQWFEEHNLELTGNMTVTTEDYVLRDRL